MNVNGIDGAKYSDLLGTIQKNKDQSDVFKNILEQQMSEKIQEDEALKSACKEFETYFYRDMLKNMRKTVQESGLVEKSPGHDIYTDMLDDEYSKVATKTSNLGIADLLYKQLSTKTKKI